MGCYMRDVVHQQAAAVLAFSSVPRAGLLSRASFTSPPKAPSSPTGTGVAASAASSYPRNKTVTYCRKTESGVFALSNVNNSKLYRSSFPFSSSSENGALDVWTPPDNHLQRCQAIFQEDGLTECVAEVIDGKAIAKEIRGEITKEVDRMKEKVGKAPGLAVVLVGVRTDSATYVRSKKKACEEVGIASFETTFPEDATENEVLESVSKYNRDPNVHGILVQLPLPKHMCEEKVLGAIDVGKDVDGFHPLNVGRLTLQGRKPDHVSCTPKGCIELLERSGVTIKGKHAVVIGRSNVVGMPVAILLQQKNATVTVVHSYTPNPAEVSRGADILIVAVGVAHFVRGDWIKPGAVVIDVGVNSVEDPKAKKGYRLAGDVCFPEASQIASKITPVPGGVGPMTIAMLLSNTLESAKRSFGFIEAGQTVS